MSKSADYTNQTEISPITIRLVSLADAQIIVMTAVILIQPILVYNIL